MPVPSFWDNSAAELVSARNMSTSEYSQAQDRTVLILERASSHTAVARSDCACERLLNDLNEPPSNDMIDTANGTDIIAIVAIFGDIKNSDIPPPSEENSLEINTVRRNR